MHYPYKGLFFLLFALIVGSCESTLDDPIPGYVSIHEFSLSTENALGISDAWVYIDDNLLGVYELPAKFPVLSEGATNLKVYPGIKVNGIRSTRSKYSFYKVYEEDIDMVSAETIKINPRSSYASWADVEWVANFDGKGDGFKAAFNSDTTIVSVRDEVFSGNASGCISLNRNDTVVYALISSTESFSIPDIGATTGIFLELNYKCDVALSTGIYLNGMVDLVTINPSDEWNKIYIDLYNTLTYYNEGTEYFIYFEANLGSSFSEANIYIDDVKIVY